MDDNASGLDNDADGIADYLDADSDNDGISDANEAGMTDVDGDGVVDNFVDADANGLDDATTANPVLFVDTDGDSVPDWLDLDSDNDGLTDIIESGGGDENGDGVVDGFTDADNNGLHDGSAGSASIDTDGDGVTDQQDQDLSLIHI